MSKNLNNIISDFEDWMKENEDVFASPKEWLREECPKGTYTVTIRGLSYNDAQNVLDFGLEFGKSVKIIAEGEE